MRFLLGSGPRVRAGKTASNPLRGDSFEGLAAPSPAEDRRCFGKVAVNPWLTVGPALIVLAGLWRWRAGIGHRAVVAGRLVLVVVAVSLAAAALWALWPDANLGVPQGVEASRGLSLRVADCPQECAPFAARWARAVLGLEIPRGGVSAGATPAAVLANLLYDAISVPGVIEVVPVERVVEDGAQGSGQWAILVHRTGHLHVVAGKVMIEGRPWYHVLHGQSGAALLSAEDIRHGHFAEAWRITGGGTGPAVRVGSTLLRLDKLYHHFGGVPAEKELECSFTVSNEGPETVVVDTPRSSCACTVVAPSQVSQLEPGGQLHVAVKFRSASAPAQRHKVYLSFSEKRSGASSRLALDVLASQREGMRVSETRLDFGRVVGGRPYARTLRLEEVPTDRFRLTDVVSHDFPLQWRAERSKTDSGLWAYVVRLELTPPREPLGLHRGEVRIFTTSAVRPRISIPVQFEVQAPVRAVPGALALGNIPVGVAQRRQIEIATDLETPVTIAVQAAPPECRVKVPPGVGKPRVDITITLERPGIWQGELVLAARAAGQEYCLVVPCAAYGVGP